MSIDHRAILKRLRSLAAKGNEDVRIPRMCILEATGFTLYRLLSLDGPMKTCRTCGFADRHRVFRQLPTCPVCMQERRMELKGDVEAFNHPYSDAIIGQPLYMYYTRQEGWYGGVVSGRRNGNEVTVSFLDSDFLWTTLSGRIMWRVSGSITNHVADEDFKFIARSYQHAVNQFREHFRRRLSEAVNLLVPIRAVCSMIACYLIEHEPVVVMKGEFE